jgi:protein-S-isoprenylcysteine O-methyltransferase Ste14
MMRCASMTPYSSLFVRAVVAFLALPGVVAILIPGLLLRPRGAGQSTTGLIVLATGLLLLLWCVRDFYVAGRGTLAPWSPPERLVQVGLYRRSRNPMYVAVLLMLVGWALSYRTTALWTYAGAVAVLFHLRVLLHEEPFLARTHGRAWTDYKLAVPRWLF